MQTLNYQVENWQRQDWLKGTRYYPCQLYQNLYGEWVILRRWGRIRANQGLSIEYPCGSYQEGIVLRSISKRRVQRGYNSF